MTTGSRDRANVSLIIACKGIYVLHECEVILYFVQQYIDQPVANLVVVSLTGKVSISLSPLAPENLVSQDGFGRPVPRQPDYTLYTHAESHD